MRFSKTTGAMLGATMVFNASGLSAKDLDKPETMTGFRTFAELIAKMDQPATDRKKTVDSVLSANAANWLATLQAAPEQCAKIVYEVVEKVDGKNTVAARYSAEFCLSASGRRADVNLNRKAADGCTFTAQSFYPVPSALTCVRR